MDVKLGIIPIIWIQRFLIFFTTYTFVCCSLVRDKYLFLICYIPIRMPNIALGTWDASVENTHKNSCLWTYYILG